MKVGVVGCGMVGATAAYAMVMRGVGRDIVLLDASLDRARAEADDIRHAVPFAHPLNIRAGDYADLAGAKVVIVAAGVAQKPGETRLELLSRNADVFREIIPQIVAVTPDCLLLIATNPVDVMTHVAIHYAGQAGIPSSRVIGSGTTLDTARFRTLLGQHLGVDARHIHGYVIGEHGDSEVLTWSLVTVGGLRLRDTERLLQVEIDEQFKQAVDVSVRQAAYRIISGKGATYYGIGAALANIVSVILRDDRAVMTVCTRVEDTMGLGQATLSLPTLFGGSGVISTLPLALDQSEAHALIASANILRQATDSLQDCL